MSTERELEEELDLLRREAEGAAQFLYQYLAIHDIGRSPKVHRALNRNPLFWNTSLGTLQTAVFIAIGRIFDQGSPHNVDPLLRLAQKNVGLFSRARLAMRKQGSATSPPSWLSEYVRDAYVPNGDDFRRLRKHVKKQRNVYEANYRDIRSKFFAHREVVDPSHLFSKTNVRELQRLVVFMIRLHDALWNLLHNGRRPTLRSARHSLRRMRDVPSPAGREGGVQERMIYEVERVMKEIA